MPETGILVQTRALEKAIRAETLIEQHIQECAVRQQEILHRFDKSVLQMEALANDLNKVNTAQAKTLGKYLFSFITLLVVCLGYFLMRFGLPGMH